MPATMGCVCRQEWDHARTCFGLWSAVWPLSGLWWKPECWFCLYLVGTAKIKGRSPGLQVILGIPSDWGVSFHFHVVVPQRHGPCSGRLSVWAEYQGVREEALSLEHSWPGCCSVPVTLGTCGVPDNVQVFLSFPLWCSVYQFCRCQGTWLGLHLKLNINFDLEEWVEMLNGYTVITSQYLFSIGTIW